MVEDDGSCFLLLGEPCKLQLYLYTIFLKTNMSL